MRFAYGSLEMCMSYISRFRDIHSGKIIGVSLLVLYVNWQSNESSG